MWNRRKENIDCVRMFIEKKWGGQCNNSYHSSVILSVHPAVAPSCALWWADFIPSFPRCSSMFNMQPVTVQEAHLNSVPSGPGLRMMNVMFGSLPVFDVCGRHALINSSKQMWLDELIVTFRISLNSSTALMNRHHTSSEEISESSYILGRNCRNCLKRYYFM